MNCYITCLNNFNGCWTFHCLSNSSHHTYVWSLSLSLLPPSSFHFFSFPPAGTTFGHGRRSWTVISMDIVLWAKSRRTNTLQVETSQFQALFGNKRKRDLFAFSLSNFLCLPFFCFSNFRSNSALTRRRLMHPHRLQSRAIFSHIKYKISEFSKIPTAQFYLLSFSIACCEGSCVNLGRNRW